MSIAKLWAITILGIIIAWIVFQAAPALEPVLIALVAAYLLNPVVEFIEKRLRVKKWLAIVLLFSIGAILLIVLGGLIITPIVNQASEFIKESQSISGNFNKVINDIFGYLANLGLSQNILGELKQYVAQFLSSLGDFLVSIITSALGFIFKVMDLAIVFIMTIYFLASGKEMVQYVVQHAPKSFRPTILNLIEGTDHVVWSYIKTQALIALIIGVASTVAFLIIGVKFSFLLGVLAGVFNFIPYFGSIIAGALAITIALLTSGLSQAIITFIAVLIIQQTEGNFITPRLQAKSADMKPVIIMIVIIVGNYFWGTMGMFVAVPLFGLVRIVVGETVKLINKME